jgi:hypothetical protein
MGAFSFFIIFAALVVVVMIKTIEEYKAAGCQRTVGPIPDKWFHIPHYEKEGWICPIH